MMTKLQIGLALLFTAALACGGRVAWPLASPAAARRADLECERRVIGVGLSSLMDARLITIPISHYCERARWALEHCQVEFEEERHLQVLHRRSVRRAGADHSVPVLVSGDQCVADSADIVAFADSLAPAGRRLRRSPGGIGAFRLHRLVLAAGC